MPEKRRDAVSIPELRARILEAFPGCDCCITFEFLRKRSREGLTFEIWIWPGKVTHHFKAQSLAEARAQLEALISAPALVPLDLLALDVEGVRA